MKFRRGAAVLLTATAIVFSACSNNSSSAAPSAASPSAPAPSGAAASAAPSAAASPSGKPVTISWWHIQNSDPGLSLWATMAKEYMAAHPNVTIETTVLENDTFKPKLQSQLQGGTVPDLFQSWGGGGMAEQVEAGLLKDITADVAPWKDTMNAGAMGMYALDGKQYGIPFDLGMVGIWYNKDHFDKAGITAPPATFDELLDRRRQAQGRGLHPDGRRRQPGDVDGDVLVGLPRDPHRRHRGHAERHQDR